MKDQNQRISILGWVGGKNIAPRETTLTVHGETCAVTMSVVGPFTYGGVCEHGITAVSGSEQGVRSLLRRKHRKS